MSTKDLLDKKKVLIVDDEPDIPATLEELLPMCVTTMEGYFDQKFGPEWQERHQIKIR